MTETLGSHDERESAELHRATVTVQMDDQISFELEAEVTPSGEVLRVLNDLQSRHHTGFDLHDRVEDSYYPQFQSFLKTMDKDKMEAEEPDYEAYDDDFYGNILVPKEAVNEAIRLGSLSLKIEGGKLVTKTQTNYREAKINNAELPEGWQNLDETITDDSGNVLRLRCYWVEGRYQIEDSRNGVSAYPQVISDDPQDQELARKVYKRCMSDMKFGGRPRLAETISLLKYSLKRKAAEDAQAAANIQNQKKGFRGRIRAWFKRGKQ